MADKQITVLISTYLNLTLVCIPASERVIALGTAERFDPAICPKLEKRYEVHRRVVAYEFAHDAVSAQGEQTCAGNADIETVSLSSPLLGLALWPCWTPLGISRAW